MQKVLFLCTGNFYRSRFAEELFNHLAGPAGVAWRADSRALAIERGNGVNFGPISRYALEALRVRGITPPDPLRFPRPLSEEDLRSARRIIALKEAEHRPLVESRFAAYAGHVEYWHVHDLDQATPEAALSEVEAKVRELLGGLALRQAHG